MSRTGRFPGTVTDVYPGTGVASTVGLFSHMGFFTGTETTPMTSTRSFPSNDGFFETDCIDASGVSLGLIALVDDSAWDGTAGTYYPTANSVASWSTPADKVCVEDARLRVLETQNLTGLAALPGFEASAGFILGYALDSSGSPVQGAVVRKADGTDFATVYYPDAILSEFSSPSTTESGMFLIPGPQPLVEARPEKAGMSWSSASVAAVPNHCYLVQLRANP